MKKLLEVLDYGAGDIRFNTDMKLTKKPAAIPELVGRLAFSMTTSLWGGSEADVLAAIRCLAVADLAVSVNREEMIRMLDHESRMLAKMFSDAMKHMEANGKVQTIYPGMNHSNGAS